MNLQLLGDSSDIIKKSFIRWLSDFGKWSVHPMFTDDVESSAAEGFARFLNATLVSGERLRAGSDRAAYFECCLSVGNLFLDPDAGISLADRTGEKSSKYIFASEILRLISARPDHLTLVFDPCSARASRSRLEDDLRRKLAVLASGGAFGFGYASHAPFLCLTGDPSVALRAFEALKENSSLPGSRLIA